MILDKHVDSIHLTIQLKRLHSTQQYICSVNTIEIKITLTHISPCLIHAFCLWSSPIIFIYFIVVTSIGHSNTNTLRASNTIYFPPWKSIRTDQPHHHRGTSGFDNSGRGYYFAEKQPQSAPSVASQVRPDVNSNSPSFKVSSHYSFIPSSTHDSHNDNNNNQNPKPTLSSSSARPSSSSSSHNHHHHLGSAQIGGSSNSEYGSLGRYGEWNHQQNTVGGQGGDKEQQHR